VHLLLLQSADELRYSLLIRRHPPGLAYAMDGNVQPVLGYIYPCVSNLFFRLPLLSGPSLPMRAHPDKSGQLFGLSAVGAGRPR
jgi:hypothetical protein